MSLLAALFLVLGFIASRAQVILPTNYFTRPSCLPGYLGCVETTVTIKFASTSTGFGSITPFSVTAPNTYGVSSAFKYAAVSIDGGVTYTSYQKIPGSLSDPTIVYTINPADPYLISISFTAANTYTFGVSHNAL